MGPAPGQIGENNTDGTVPQQNTEYVYLSPGLLEEEDNDVSGTVSNRDSGAAYVGERIEKRDDII